MAYETYLQFFRSPNSASTNAICADEAPSCPLPAGYADSFRSHLDLQSFCKNSMVEVLRLLCDPQLSESVNLNTFFFLTDSLTVGGTLHAPVPSTAPADNIGSAAASFRRFSPCNNGLLEIAGTAYFTAVPGNIVALETTDQISGLSLKAAAFTLIDAEDVGETASTYRHAFRAFRRGLSAAPSAGGGGCDADGCTSALLAELSTRTLSRVVSFTAGPLVLQNVSVVGSLGNTIVLGNEPLRRFYLVCTEDIEVLG